MTSTAEVDAIRAAIEARWSGLSDLGTFNCRRIRGQYASGDAWSQHAWGNAWDIGAPPATLDAIEGWLPRSGLPVGRTLRYDDHLHVEGSPERTGTPPCAGGTDDQSGAAATVQPAVGVVGLAGATAPLSAVLGAITDPTMWLRVALGAGGLVVGLLGLVLLSRDLLPRAAVQLAARGAA